MYSHGLTAEIPFLLTTFYADSSFLREKHGPILRVRRDNASVNVSQQVLAFLNQHGIRSETSNPYEPWQNGQPERLIQTLCNTARTVLVASGLEGRFWYQALQYSVRIHNIQYARTLDSSPYFVMFGSKPDVSRDQPFGVEAWIHLRPEQRRDPKFGARGESCIFVGYPTHQSGYLVWCPSRGPNTVVSSSNLIFGTRFPRAKSPPPDLLPDMVKEVFLPSPPTAFTVQEVHHTPDLQIIGSVQDQLVLASQVLASPKCFPISCVMDLLNHTNMENLSSAHVHLTDSYALLGMDPMPDPAQNRPVPRNSTEAQSPDFAPEWEPAMDREIQGFLHHQCFAPVPATPALRTLPGTWLFSRKRNGAAKARFVIGGHRQRLGIDYFEFKNYCAVLASRDNRILLGLAAAQGWSVAQTDVEQAFLHGVLNDVDLYIHPPARYPCPPGHVLKLLKAVYGLHQAPPKFKKEVTDWLRSNGYAPANDSETIWIMRKDQDVLVHGLYADDFLHFSNNSEFYTSFRDQFKKRFDIKTGPVDVYLGNRICVDSDRYNVLINQTAYIDELLGKFGMGDSRPVATPIVSRLSNADRGNDLSKEDHAQYRVIVGSLLYLSCWTRPDISFAVSELSRFVADPGDIHMKAAKRVLRYLKGTRDLGLRFTRPERDKLNQLWGYVDSDWAGCPDSRKSTTGYVLLFNGAVISWKSKRQNVVALSSAEAEFMAASSLVQEVIYIRRLLDRLGFPQNDPTPIGEDNRTCIAWGEGAVGGSDRAKHIDLRRHFVHDAVKAGILTLHAVSSSDNIADLLTKPLAEPVFLLLRKRMMGS